MQWTTCSTPFKFLVISDLLSCSELDHQWNALIALNHGDALLSVYVSNYRDVTRTTVRALVNRNACLRLLSSGHVSFRIKVRWSDVYRVNLFSPRL